MAFRAQTGNSFWLGTSKRLEN